MGKDFKGFEVHARKNGAVLRRVLRDDSDEDQEENVSVLYMMGVETGVIKALLLMSQMEMKGMLLENGLKTTLVIKWNRI